MVTTVSVLRRGKGIEVLLEAVPEILRRVPRARFVFVGDGPLRSSLDNQARSMGLGGCIRWLGFRRDIPALLEATDLFVRPSLEDAFPTVLLEAMAMGLPVVASRVGGIPEIVIPGQTGTLVEAGDAPGLAQAVSDLLLQPTERAACGEAARRRAQAEFSIQNWLSRLEALYREAMVEKRRSREDIRESENRSS